MSEITHDMRAAAIAHLEGNHPDDYSEGYDETIVELGREEWLIVTDDEANTAAEAAIRDSVWAFNADFLASHSVADADIFRLLQQTERAESLNEPFLSLLTDIEEFIEDAVAADGRGHFLAGYDGREHEVPAGEYEFTSDDPDFDLASTEDGSDIPQVTTSITLPEMLYVYRTN